MGTLKTVCLKIFRSIQIKFPEFLIFNHLIWKLNRKWRFTVKGKYMVCTMVFSSIIQEVRKNSELENEYDKYQKFNFRIELIHG